MVYCIMIILFQTAVHNVVSKRADSVKEMCITKSL